MANVFSEPNPAIAILRCVRSQRRYRCKDLSFYAALQSKKQPFMQTALKSSPALNSHLFSYLSIARLLSRSRA